MNKSSRYTYTHRAMSVGQHIDLFLKLLTITLVGCAILVSVGCAKIDPSRCADPSYCGYDSSYCTELRSQAQQLDAVDALRKHSRAEAPLDTTFTRQ